MRYFKGKRILITGGSSGIGKSLAKSLIKIQANVCILAKDEYKLKAAQRELQGMCAVESQLAIYIVSDVSKLAEIEKCRDYIIKELGGIDIIINCAGISRPGYITKITKEDWDAHMNVNYTGTVNICLSFLPLMLEQKSGQIVNISSSAGYIGLFGYAPYSASKFAIVGFSESLRQEVKPYNIKVNVVYPPDTETPMLKEELKYRPYETNKLSKSVKPLSSEFVAKSIIRGMIKNKMFIVPDFSNKIFHVLNRYFPLLLRFYIDYIIKKNNTIPNKNN